MQIVNNRQSLAIFPYPHSSCYTGDVDPHSNSHKNTHLIGDLHVADSLEVSFIKFAMAVFNNPNFDL